MTASAWPTSICFSLRWSLLLNGIIISDFRWYISEPRTNLRRQGELSFAGKTDLVGAIGRSHRDAGSE
jgi:hypothetical protein